jgi:hypothetical protein
VVVLVVVQTTVATAWGWEEEEERHPSTKKACLFLALHHLSPTMRPT